MTWSFLTGSSDGSCLKSSHVKISKYTMGEKKYRIAKYTSTSALTKASQKTTQDHIHTKYRAHLVMSLEVSIR